MCKHMPKFLQRRAAIIAVPTIHQDNAKPMGRSAQTVARSITSERYAEAGEVQVPDQWEVEEDHIDTMNIN